jgi:hypothetical protein
MDRRKFIKTGSKLVLVTSSFSVFMNSGCSETTSSNDDAFNDGYYDDGYYDDGYYNDGYYNDGYYN